MKRINHEEAYSLEGACTNWAEEFLPAPRRDWTPSPSSICSGMRKRRPPHVECRAGKPDCRARDGAQAVRGFQRILAAANPRGRHLKGISSFGFLQLLPC